MLNFWGFVYHSITVLNTFPYKQLSFKINFRLFTPAKSISFLLSRLEIPVFKANKNDFFRGTQKNKPNVSWACFEEGTV